MEEKKKAPKKIAPKKIAPKKIDLSTCEKSFTVTNDKEGWYFVTNYIQGNELVKKEKIGPTMRAVVIDEFKIEAQRHIEKMETI